jgi:hypothetical protein
MSNQPNWLDRDPLEQRVIWEQATASTMADFLNTYTLHDSFLRQIRIKPNFESLLIIGFDLVWNKQISSGYDILAISFPQTYRVTYSMGSPYGATIASASTAIITEQEREELWRHITAQYDSLPDEVLSRITDDELTKTIIEDIFFGKTEIIHGRQIQILLLNNNEELLPFVPIKPLT